MKKIILFIFPLILSSTYLFGDESLFKKANKEYETGNYDVAIDIYNNLIQMDKFSSDLYYNLGNAYYKIENWAEAIWCYEMSLKIKHNDKTIENLNIARTKITNRIEPLPESFYKKWWKKIINLFTIIKWQIITIFSFWLTTIIIIITNFKLIKMKKYFFMILCSICVFCFFITQYSYKNFIKKEAIIFSSSLPVNSEPTKNFNNKKLFNLSLGTKVEVIKTKNDWIYIKLNDGRKGWIKENNVKRLN